MSVIFSYCHDNIEEVLPKLLPKEISCGVLEVCAKISERLALNKIHEWMNMHITTGTFF